MSAIDKLQTSLQENIKNEDNRNYNEITIKNICKIMDIISKKDDFNCSSINSFLAQLITLSSQKTVYKGLTNKISFLLMDYCEENGLEY